MIICIVPSPVYAQAGTILHGRSEYSGLPDFMLGSSVDLSSQALREYIGDDIYLPNFPLYKVYAVWKNTLFEYTLLGSSINCLEDTSEFLFPISVKRYYSDHKTYLYMPGINTVSSMIKPVYKTQPDAAISISHFFNDLVQRSDPSQSFFTEVTKSFKPTFFDYCLSEECPDEITNILFELGNQCYGYSTSALNYLYFNYGADINLLSEIFSYGQADDVISAYGCSDNPAFKLEKLLPCIRPDSNAFYQNVAKDQIAKNSQMFNLRYMDRTCQWYDLFAIESLLQSLYKQTVTDLYAIITPNHIDVQSATLFYTYCVCSPENCWDEIRIKMNQMNQHMCKNNPMVKICINKTWLDELFFSIAFADGTIENWFINLSLFHLYSPSIIRAPLETVINSFGK